MNDKGYPLIRAARLCGNRVRQGMDIGIFVERVKMMTISNVSFDLEHVASWMEDLDRYYDNLGQKMSKDIDWGFLETLFYVGKIYEQKK